MWWITRLTNIFRRQQLDGELEEEMASHIVEAVRRGRSPEEARRAFGSTLRYREASHDVKVFTWLESLLADLVFGWRQIVKHRAVSLGAILSLALAAGAVTGIYRVLEALLLRPLPIASPERFHYIEIETRDREGRTSIRDDFSYPQFRDYRRLLDAQADLLLAGYTAPQELTFGGDDRTEKFYRQYLSGNVFSVFELQPALGRLSGPDDDRPGAHPVAVISYHYWTRRFGRDPEVTGKTFRYGNRIYEIAGVAPKGFIGTEPGSIIDAFIPAAFNTQALDSAGWSWFRILVHPKPGVALPQIEQQLKAALVRERQEQIQRLTTGTPKDVIAAHLDVRVRFLPAAAGASDLQRQFRQPLMILIVLASLLLLIACANVANLRTAQAAAREKETALRVSIGAGRWRLIQLALAESALVALSASVLGALFAWFTVPVVVSMLTPPERPALLVLDPDLRLLGFVVALAISITLLFGLPPALRASAVKPIGALKGGHRSNPRRLTNVMLAAQVAFCMSVLLVAGLFLTTFDRLTNQPLGFSPKDVTVIQTDAAGQKPAEAWAQALDNLRHVAGIESACAAGWPLLSGNGWTVGFRIGGQPSQTPSLALDVSAGFFQTMRIGWLDGRDFRLGDQPPANDHGRPTGGVGIVNETFARRFFGGQNPVGKSLEIYVGKDAATPIEIVGYVRDARYRNLRDPILPTLYVPMTKRKGGSIIVRTAGAAAANPAFLREQVARSQPGFRANSIATQTALVERHSIRERLLAALSVFFAATALVLAGMGLYSVLNYAVVRRSREIGIRIALGARVPDVVRKVSFEALLPVILGSAIGVACGLACERYARSLLYDVKALEFRTFAAPLLMLLSIGVIAALRPLIRAVRIDPARALRSE